MSEEVLTEQQTDTAGAIEPERFYAPANLGAILLLQQGDGWASGFEANLPDCTEFRAPQANGATLTRGEAATQALESLIAWCGEQKETGSKKHRKAAASMQEWALAIEREMPALVAVPDNPPLPESFGQIPDLHTSASDGELRLIPTEDLHESPLNPRQVYPEAPMAELTASMRAVGFRRSSPITVTPRSQGGYWIAAGHRRKRAAEAAGIKEVPCIVERMDEGQLLDALNFDNSGREDVHPLHEAAGWRVWLAKTGKGVQDIADRIGQSKEYVYQRLKYADLIPDACAAFLDGQMTAGHAILIARLSEQHQARALDYLTPPSWDSDRQISVRQLAAWIKQNCAEKEDAPAVEAPAPSAPAAAEPQRTAEPAPAAPPKQRAEPKAAGPTSAPVVDVQAELAAERRDNLAEKVYVRVVDAILEKVQHPLQAGDMGAVLAVMADVFYGGSELADKFAIPRTGGPRHKDIAAAIPKLSPQKVARMIVAGLLLDIGYTEGYLSPEVLKGFAKRYGVNVEKIRAEVEGGTRREVAKPADHPKAKAPAKKAAAPKPVKNQKLSEAIAKMCKAAAKKGAKK